MVATSSHLFCIVPRRQLIHDHLLFHDTEEDLAIDLCRTVTCTTWCFRNQGLVRKIQQLLQIASITTKHISLCWFVCLARSSWQRRLEKHQVDVPEAGLALQKAWSMYVD